jgi:hypothetical protein
MLFGLLLRYTDLSFLVEEGGVIRLTLLENESNDMLSIRKDKNWLETGMILL